MLRGFLSVKWHQIASSHFTDSPDGQDIANRNDGAHRVHRAIKIMHNLTNEIWMGRNEAMHGVKIDQESCRLSLIDAEITKFHSEADLVLTDDRFYCETSLSRLLHSSTANKRRWLIRVKASRQRRAVLHDQQPRITKYFPQLDRTSSNTRTAKGNTKTSSRNKLKQQLMTYFTIQQPPNITSTSARNQTTQQILTNFLQERASNSTNLGTTTPSPTPAISKIG